MLDNSLRTETHSLLLFVEADYDGLFFVCLFRKTAVVVCNRFHFSSLGRCKVSESNATVLDKDKRS